MSSRYISSLTPLLLRRLKLVEIVVTAKEVKVTMLNTFDRVKDKLKKFILQVELYISF